LKGSDQGEDSDDFLVKKRKDSQEEQDHPDEDQIKSKKDRKQAAK
jgi:hypothetical protein